MIQKYNETPGRAAGQKDRGDNDATGVSLNNTTALQDSSYRAGTRVDSTNHRQQRSGSHPRIKPDSSAIG